MVNESIIRLLSSLISSLIISIGIMILGYFISSALTNALTDPYAKTHFPSSFDINFDDSKSNQEFLSGPKAASYLSMNDDVFKQLVDSGEFASTYIELNGQYIFSRSRIDNYLWNLIDSKK